MFLELVSSMSLMFATAVQNTPQRVDVGSRPLPPEKEIFIEEQKAQENQEEVVIAEPAVSYNPSLPIRFAASQQISKFYHWVNAIINYGDCIEFEDGSNWKISPSDAYKAISWRKDDPVVVTPNHTWFSHYNYSITNQTNGTSVQANLFLAPISFGPYTHWIVALDKFSGHIFLEDGSSWKISFEDRHLFDEYAINDFVIIGYNDAWFSSHNYILINVNMNNHIRAYSF